MLSLDEVKEYLRIDSSDEDTLVTSLMQTAHSLVMDVARLDEEGRFSCSFYNNGKQTRIRVAAVGLTQDGKPVFNRMDGNMRKE